MKTRRTFVLILITMLAARNSAAQDKIVTLFPEPTAEESVIAAAKRDLEPGDVIDGIGGEAVYGVTDSASSARADGLVPLGLLAGATVTRRVRTGEPLPYDAVEIDEATTIYALRRLQDQLLGHDCAPTVVPRVTSGRINSIARGSVATGWSTISVSGTPAAANRACAAGSASIAVTDRFSRASGRSQSNSSSVSAKTTNRVPNPAGQTIRSAGAGTSGR